MPPPSAAAKSECATAYPARSAAGWLGLAASPTFALMAWIASGGPPQGMLCAMQSGVLPIDGMTAMYLLMALFHLAPWLKLAAGRP